MNRINWYTERVIDFVCAYKRTITTMVVAIVSTAVVMSMIANGHIERRARIIDSNFTSVNDAIARHHGKIRNLKLRMDLISNILHNHEKLMETKFDTVPWSQNPGIVHANTNTEEFQNKLKRKILDIPK